jgi:large subunit ribosomal protein L6
MLYELYIMSRIGKKPINIPVGVKVTVSEKAVSVSGPKGALTFEYHGDVAISVSETEILVEKRGKSKKAPAIWGTTARIIENMVTGVTQGFEKKIELNGVGYRMNAVGNKITMALGFSHPVIVEAAKELSIKIEGNTLSVTGIDKQLVGQFAANIKALKPVEPYKGKGFRYLGEHVRRKEGKKSSK